MRQSPSLGSEVSVALTTPTLLQRSYVTKKPAVDFRHGMPMGQRFEAPAVSTRYELVCDVVLQPALVG